MTFISYQPQRHWNELFAHILQVHLESGRPGTHTSVTLVLLLTQHQPYALKKWSAPKRENSGSEKYSLPAMPTELLTFNTWQCHRVPRCFTFFGDSCLTSVWLCLIPHRCSVYTTKSSNVYQQKGLYGLMMPHFILLSSGRNAISFSFAGSSSCTS